MTDLQRNSAGELHHWFTLYNTAWLGVAEAVKSTNRSPQPREVWSVVGAWMDDESQPFNLGLVKKGGDPRKAMLVVSATLAALETDATGIETRGKRSQAVPALLKQVIAPSTILILPQSLAGNAEQASGGILSALLGLEALLDDSRVEADAESLAGVSQSLLELRELLVTESTMDDEVRRLLLSRVAQAEGVITAARSGVDIESALERLAGSLLIYAEAVPGPIVQRAWAAISGALRTRKLEVANTALQAGAVVLAITHGG